MTHAAQTVPAMTSMNPRHRSVTFAHTLLHVTPGCAAADIRAAAAQLTGRSIDQLEAALRSTDTTTNPHDDRRIAAARLLLQDPTNPLTRHALTRFLVADSRIPAVSDRLYQPVAEETTNGQLLLVS